MNAPFLAMLKKMEAIHNKKSADYAKDTNLYSNFEFSGLLASKFTHPVDISMAALIGTKLERLANLLSSNKEPQNESVDDNFLDLCTYMALWAAYRDYKKETTINSLEELIKSGQVGAMQVTDQATVCGICNGNHNTINCSFPNF